MTTASAVRDVLREIHRELTSLLLAGAMIAPLAAGIAGWPVHTPLGVPLLVHATAVVAIALLRIGLDDRIDAPPAIRWVHVPLVPLVAAAFARLVQARANVFYTERLLVDGMAALFFLHIAAGPLRSRARRRRDWSSAAMRLADSLCILAGWLVLASWTLIALEHRHPAGPLLLAAGGLEALALLALVPDAMATLPFVPHFFRRES